MRLCVFLCILAFSLPCLAAQEDPEITPSITHGGLTCFSLTPPAEIPLRITCNDLCAERGAACMGLNSHSSGTQKCEDTAAQTQPTCRCCAVEAK